MCHNAGVILAFLPPYSPDYNPIEEAFAELKAWMKKNRALAEPFGTDFEGFIRLGLETLSSKAGNHFRSCHIGTESINDN
jgi:transposase